ncbi:MAG: TetR/AcrR family transcriptional regulator [Peptostreptococcaceae bacterium]|nr:TetR/AcrR family transcriptional regulator [Peptostreptococcaceae bacterium]
MQYTKTQELLLESGRRWFLEKGFKSAPLRSIVKDAGFTPGAFYGYYKTKEDLFYALTEETAEGVLRILRSIIDEMESLPKQRMIFEMADCYLRRLPELVDYICRHKEAATLLLKCSEGTKYENFLDALRLQNKERISRATDQARESGEKIRGISPETFDLLMRGYFHMLSMIFLEEEDPKRICRMMADIALVYKNGMLRLMEEE